MPLVLGHIARKTVWNNEERHARGAPHEGAPR
jgi:hypothetical protein